VHFKSKLQAVKYITEKLFVYIRILNISVEALAICWVTLPYTWFWSL